VLWCGDNECDYAYYSAGFGKDPNTNRLTRRVLPDILGIHDPIRSYLPSSPFIATSIFEGGREYLPQEHLWGPRDYYKSDYYTKSLCHFTSEIGYHGCPSPESIKKFISPERLWPYQDNLEWQVHATSPIIEEGYADMERVHLMGKQIREVFGEIPDTLEAFAEASQITQAEAFKFFIEHFRAQKWRKTGIIWWNLIDGWPQFSDAVVDYYMEKKRAYEYIKRAQQDICVVLKEPNSWKQAVVVCNDTREDVSIKLKITDVGADKVVLEAEGISRNNAVTPLGSLNYTMSKQTLYLIEWESAAGNGRNHFLAGNPPFNLAQYKQWMKQAGML
jgi:beta-mannosidase